MLFKTTALESVGLITSSHDNTKQCLYKVKFGEHKNIQIQTSVQRKQLYFLIVTSQYREHFGSNFKQ